WRAAKCTRTCSSSRPRAKSSAAASAPPGSSRNRVGLMKTVVVDDLHKSYGAVDAVRGVSFEIAEGEVFALLGPNGAGKTTIVEILEGYRTRRSGRVSVLGFDPAKGDRSMKDRSGIVLQWTGVEAFLTVGETIAMYR